MSSPATSTTSLATSSSTPAETGAWHLHGHFLMTRVLHVIWIHVEHRVSCPKGSSRTLTKRIIHVHRLITHILAPLSPHVFLEVGWVPSVMLRRHFYRHFVSRHL